MTVRRIAVLASALTLVGLAGAAVLGVMYVLKTASGRAYAREFVLSRFAPKVKGKLYVGKIDGLFPDVRIDSVEIRDPGDSLFLATGPISFRYDLRDLFDQRIRVRRLDVRRATLVMRRDSLDEWNWRHVFPEGPRSPVVTKTKTGFGALIVADSANVRDLQFVLAQPWQPADSLRGARRDSAITTNLQRTDTEIRRSGSGFERTWRWRIKEFALSHVRISDPDSAGRLFKVSKLDVDESEPPFAFRNIRGEVAWLGDTITLRLPHFDLPGSTGSGSGRIWWGSGLPNRYDIRIVGDSVALADVAWVYPTLPETGGGKMVLTIRNERDLHVLDYALSDMDVRTTRSRLRGNMTFGVGAPVLIVKDLDMRADPLDFELIKAFNGKPFPYDWRGTLVGTVKARGGPVNRFVVDSTAIVFNDANVPGAVARASARGELDILFPAFTVFRGLDVNVQQLDLRTPQALNKEFPRIGGTISGTARLDSSWLDVRFRNADLTHHDGPAPPTRMTGSGRVTIGDEFLTYDLALNASPLSFTTLARSYAKLPLRGPYTGPLRVQGTLADLAVTGELTGAGGTMAVDGQFDLFPPGYAAKGTTEVTSLNLRALFDTATMPVTRIDGRARMDVTGDSLSNLRGTLAVETDRSMVDSMRVSPSMARLTFIDSRARLDTLHVETAIATLSAAGALGLLRSTPDSLRFSISADSLGGLRRWLGPAPLVAGQSELQRDASDSLPGTVMLRGTVHGAVDSLSARGTLSMADAYVRGHRAKSTNAEFTFLHTATSDSGSISARIDTARIAGVQTSYATVVARLRERKIADIGVYALSENGPQASLEGRVQVDGDSVIADIKALRVTIGKNEWSLPKAVRVVSNGKGVTLDSILLRGSTAGRVTLAGTVPASGPVALRVSGDGVPLADLGTLAQTSVPLDGRVSFRADVTGTRDDPRVEIESALDSARFGDVHLDRVTGKGSYAAKRFDAQLDLFRNKQSVLSVKGSVPYDLSLRSVARRDLPNEPVRGTIRSDSVGLGIVEAFTAQVSKATGQFSVNLDVGGTSGHPELSGTVNIINGGLAVAPMGDVYLRNIDAQISFFGDSIDIQRFSLATNEGSHAGVLRLGGWVNQFSFNDYKNASFDLRLFARDFHAIDRKRLAHLDITTSPELRLVGSYDGADLTGGVIVDHGAIYIPELLDKRIIDLNDPTVYSLIDSSVFASRALLPRGGLLANLGVSDVRVRMGDDVALQSSEAKIYLGGTVNVTVARSQNRARPFEQFALTGQLNTLRGRYVLDLGLVKRTFNVQSGTITFLGDPELNPLLNISAEHTVRTFSSGTSALQRDVVVRVHIGGSLAQPVLDLTSGAGGAVLSSTDLVSYLITGLPDFGVSGNNTALLSGIAGTFGAALSNRFSAGGLFDVFDLELGAGANGNQTALGGLLGNSRLGLGKQVFDRTFVSLTAGLCPLGSIFGGQAATGSASSLTDLIGMKVEQRLSGSGESSVSGISASLEPSTSAAACAGAGGAGGRGFVPTPKQLGFDLFKTWRF